jgi:hypothetical protein
MIFDGKPAQAISAEDLRRLVAEAVAEDRDLDYKERPYTPNAYGTAELAKDVTAFLNADGGYLIIGVKEDGSGRAVGFVDVDDPEGVRRSIIDRCLARIDPRPPHLAVGLLEIDGKNVVIVQVPESDQKPHCAKPDAEHHCFWRRYQDGNKLMTTAEIRECLEGDRVERELAELRRDIAHLRRGEALAREINMEVDDAGLLELDTVEAFLSHIERRFMDDVRGMPCYRLFACPMELNRVSLRDKASALRDLVAKPPVLRPHGWPLRPPDPVRVSELGPIAEFSCIDQLRVLWNGYTEFRITADDDPFEWAQSGDPRPANPYAIVEPAVCFALLTKEVCLLSGYPGSVRFGLGLYNAEGMCLLPGPPGSAAYRIAQFEIGRTHGPQPFPDKHLRTHHDVRATDLPGIVAWRLVSDVYYAFGYSDEQIPFFDDRHQCTIGALPSEGETSP